MKTKLLLILIGGIILLLSCGKLTDDNKDITIKVWETYTNIEHDIFVKIVKDFEKYYLETKGIKVHIQPERVPFNDLITNIKMAAMTGNTPDIGRIPYEKILELAYHQVLIPLDTIKNFNASSIEEFSAPYFKPAFNTNIIEVKGARHLYGLPDQTTFPALFYNKGMFESRSEELKKAGLDPDRPPDTWDELVEYAKVLTIPEKKQYGIALDNSLWWTLPVFYSYHAQIIKKDDRGFFVPAIPDKLSIAALQRKIDICVKTYDKGDGKITKIEAGAWRSGAIGPDLGFINNNYAMIFMGPWNVKRFKDVGLNFGIGLIPRPSKSEAIKLGLIQEYAADETYNEKITSATVLGGTNMAIFKSCKYPDIALDFLKFLTNEKNQLEWCVTLGQIPVNINIYDEVLNQTTTEIQAFLRQAPYAYPAIMLPQGNLVENDIFNPLTDLAYKGEKTAEDVLTEAAAMLSQKILRPVNDSLK